MWLDSNKNDKGLVEFEDVVKTLSDRLELPYKEVEEICALSLDYIKHLTEDKEVLSILIPYLGVMYYSERIGDFHQRRFSNFESGKNKEYKKELYEFLDYRKKLILRMEEENKVKKSYHRKRPFLYKFYRILKKSFNIKVGRGATLGFREVWTQLSEIQNKIQNE